jgi:hypothetical protein
MRAKMKIAFRVMESWVPKNGDYFEHTLSVMEYYMTAMTSLMNRTKEPYDTVIGMVSSSTLPGRSLNLISSFRIESFVFASRKSTWLDRTKAQIVIFKSPNLNAKKEYDWHLLRANGPIPISAFQRPAFISTAAPKG